jgi:hypothetical protein
MIDRGIRIVALCLLVTACAAPGPKLQAVSVGETVVEQRLAVVATTPWNRFESGQTEGRIATWTHEGMPLDTVQFYVGIKSGDPIAPAPTDAKAARPPVFRAEMTPSEIVELLRATWTEGGSDFTLERLESREFSGHAGFQFRYAFIRGGDEVQMRGVAYGAVIDRELFLIDYMAPRLGYFERFLPEVEALAASARVLR